MESDWAIADRKRWDYYSMSSWCSQDCPELPLADSAWKATWFVLNMICLSLLTVSNLHCPHMPHHYPAFNKILNLYLGIHPPKEISHQNPTTEFKAPLPAFLPRCMEPVFPLVSITVIAQDSHPRLIENFWFPWTYQCHVASYLFLCSALTASRHSTQKSRDDVLLNLGGFSCTLHPFEVSFVCEHSSPTHHHCV